MITPTTTLRERHGDAASFSTCITACEACLVACNACPDALGADEDAPAISELVLCVQLCEMALHAMSTRAVVAPDACIVCARSCEKVARLFMLLAEPERRRCARACYRAAQECRKVAALRLRGPADGERRHVHEARSLQASVELEAA